MATGITFSGVATGIDTESIISRLKEVSQRPIHLYQQKQATLQTRLSAWQDVNKRLLSLQTAAKALAEPAALSQIKGSVADTAVASVSAEATAITGSFSLEVTQLAQSQRIRAAGSFSDVSTGLNLSGDIVVNGKTVRLDISDTLGNVVSKINAAGAGVTASLLSVGPGDVRLSLSATATGKAGALAITAAGADGEAALTTLGLVGAAATAPRYTTTSAGTITAYGTTFSDAATTLKDLIGLTSNLTGSFTVNGKQIDYDTSVDTLQTLADKIQTGGLPAGLSEAKVVAVTGGASGYQMQIAGAAEPVFAGDANGLLTMLGLTARTPQNEVSAARDAQFRVDGLDLSRPTNTVTDAMTGLTLSLLKENPGAPTTVTLSRDGESAAKAVTNFVDAYNQMATFFKEQFAFDPDSPTSTPLSGNLSLQQIQNDLAEIVSGVVPGLSGDTNNLAGVGIRLNTDGTLAVDSAALNKAIAADPQSVSRLFTTVGSATQSSVQFLRAGDKTRDSGGAGYEVNVTVAATQAADVSDRAMGSETLAAVETLTFNGTLFGNQSVVLTLAAGQDLAGIIRQINSEPTVGKMLLAYDNNGALAFKAYPYGTAGSFGIKSDTVAGANTTGIGTALRNRVGINVEGTIGGETATGSGQLLTGDAGNLNTDGLSVLINGGATGTLGNVWVSRGIASQMVSSLSYLTDTNDGIVADLTKNVQTQIDDITKTIADMNERLSVYETQLRTQFTTMESQVARYQAIGSQLSQQISALSSGSSSSSSK